MTEPITQSEINDILWKACDTFRGAVDPSEYKNYILVMLFIKYMSDLWKDKREQYAARYGGDHARVDRALSRERFRVPAECDFETLLGQRNEPNIGELINVALERIEDENKEKLEGVFRNIDFNSEANLGQTRERNRRLKSLLEDFANPKLDLRPSHLASNDVIGDAYEYLIARFASGAGKKAGEFYTPAEVSALLARLVRPKPGDRICDPACGSGSLLIKVAREIRSPNFSLFGQESNGSTWSLCRMNMFLHEMDSARIEWCDTITNPKLIEGDSLMRFNCVVANPPFSLDKWGADYAPTDRFNRFHRGIPPTSKGDYAFISHMVEIALPGEGRVAVIVPHGVLFRGGAEGRIREKLIQENLLEAVIGLPATLFYGTGIPAAILVFNKGKTTTDILFIDASRDYADSKNQNRLRPEDLDRIFAAFTAFKSVPKYAHRATAAEVKENEYNLNIPRYVDTFEPEPEVDIPAVQKEIEDLERQLVETRREMAGYLKELGLAR
ncbi:MAG: type I restriction-modification system subunit M [Lentisphaerae bacterium RIFOXYB12_FULL_65_16]|nr:MAG: type I restriction-modification system subunit M [Lentisphaerae bacterium RIFOXYA12_64_32]OGV91773.1 MAG: type I restriction-modification system subunit M [Lentisphaerae bacterium RIFOXYB12_FULL_65_16]